MSKNKNKEVSKKIICTCGNARVDEAIDIFSHTDLPYRKAKKLVTKCNKTCCRASLMRLFEMVTMNNVDYPEIEYLLTHS